MKHPWIASGEWWLVNDEWWLMGWIDLYGWFMVMVNSGYFMPFIMMNGDKWDVTLWYINIDPENHQFSLETNHPTPSHGRVVMVIYWRICIYIYIRIYTHARPGYSFGTCSPTSWGSSDICPSVWISVGTDRSGHDAGVHGFQWVYSKQDPPNFDLLRT